MEPPSHLPSPCSPLLPHPEGSGGMSSVSPCPPRLQPSRCVAPPPPSHLEGVVQALEEGDNLVLNLAKCLHVGVKALRMGWQGEGGRGA